MLGGRLQEAAMPYTPKGPDESAHQGPDSFGHTQDESPKPPTPMPVDVLPIPARDMPENGVEEIGDDDALLESERERESRR
jgi:hypothetical protein